MYLYRTVDKLGQTIDFLLTEKRDQKAAKRFLNKAISRHGTPEKINIDKSGANAPAQTTSATMSQQEFVNQDVYFAYDSFTLSAEAKSILEQKAMWLAENPRTTVQIEGHCDERGTTVYNLVLGERRANFVKRYLVALGIDTSQLSTISYGEELPVDHGHTEAAWARNRRAHFVVTSQ